MDCNFTHPELDSKTAELIAESQQHGIVNFLVPGASLEESSKCMALAREYPSTIFPTAGVHPYHVNDQACTDETIKHLRTMITDPQGKAIHFMLCMNSCHSLQFVLWVSVAWTFLKDFHRLKTKWLGFMPNWSWPKW